jgi:hypothetical protein
MQKQEQLLNTMAIKKRLKCFYIQKERKCTNCSEVDIEDEKHFVVDCPLYENIRVKFFDKVIDLCPNFRHGHIIKICLAIY